MTPTEAPLLIAGGGIGGLSTALALAKRGFRARVLERGSFSDTTGAGIQLGANAVRRLTEIGAYEAIEARSFRPEALHIFDALSGKQLKTVPFGKTYEARYGAPYLSLKRADLAHALFETCQSVSAIALQDHFNIDRVVETAGHVRVEGPESEDAPLLIGADGLWSKVREAIAPDARLTFTGHSAARTLLRTETLPAPFDRPAVTLWLARGAHMVTYPVGNGDQLNIVLATQGGRELEGWNTDADTDETIAAAKTWHAAPRALLDRTTSWRRWSLYKMETLPRWHSGRMVLLGDAAHPVLPYMAQGAALAIEDALALADALKQAGDDYQSAFAAYEAARRARATRVMRQSAKLGRIYHLGQPFAAARNFAISRQPADSSLSQFDWLYGA